MISVSDSHFKSDKSPFTKVNVTGSPFKKIDEKRENDLEYSRNMDDTLQQQTNVYAPGYPACQQMMSTTVPNTNNFVYTHPNQSTGVLEKHDLITNYEEKYNDPDYMIADQEKCVMHVIKSSCVIKRDKKQSYNNCSGWNDVTNTTKMQSRHTADVAAFFYIREAIRWIQRNEERREESVLLKCISKDYGEFQIWLSMDIFERKRIKSEIEAAVKFPSFNPSINDKKINNLLYHYIKRIWNSEAYELKCKPGFYMDNDRWNFIVYDKNDPTIQSDAMLHFRFPVKKFLLEEARAVVHRQCQYIMRHGSRDMVMLLILLRLSALMYTPLKHLGYQFEKVMVITGCNSQDKRNLLRSFLQVYNREDDENCIYAFSEKETTLKKQLLHHKDDIVIINDDSIDNPYKKKTARTKMQMMTRLCVNHEAIDGYVPDCQCAVISDYIMNMHEIAKEAFLHIDFCELQCNADAYKNIMRMNQQFDQVLVYFVQTLFVQYAEKFKVLDEEGAGYYKYTQSASTYKVLSVVLSIFRNLCEFYDCHIITEDVFQEFDDYCYNQILDSESFYDEEHIVDDFRYELSDEILKGAVYLVVNEKQSIEITQDKPVVYVDGEWLLISVDYFRKIEQRISFGTVDTDGTKLREILLRCNLLNTNCGEKRLLYRASIMNESGRNYFVAVKNTVLDEEAAERLPIQRTTFYEAFLPEDDVERVKLGTTSEGRPVYWSIGKLQNRNLFIRGKTRSGKTYFLISVAKKLHALGKRVIIFDYSSPKGYDEYELKKVLPEAYIQENITIGTDANLDFVLEHEKNIVIIQSSPRKAEQLLCDLFDYCDAHKAEEKETYVVFDEAASMDISTDSALGNVILNGQKISFNILAATQVLAGEGVVEKTKLLTQSSVKLAFGLDEKTAAEAAREIDRKNLKNHISTIEELLPGEALVYGMLEDSEGNIKPKQYVKIKVTLD